jgi:hypothetical protein
MCSNAVGYPTPSTVIEPVYVQTLGQLRVTHQQQELAWRGGGLGIYQLQRMASYLIAHINQSVAKSDIIALGSPDNWQRLRRPHNLISGLRTMFQHWGLASVLKLSQQSITLIRHPLWYSDTDRIRMLVQQADWYQAHGEQAAAFDALLQASCYCQGSYLPDYDSVDYPLNHEAVFWLEQQRIVLQRLGHLALARNDDNEIQQASLAVLKLTQLLPECEDYRLIAQLCKRARHHVLAKRYYELVDRECYG